MANISKTEPQLKQSGWLNSTGTHTKNCVYQIWGLTFSLNMDIVKKSQLCVRKTSTLGMLKGQFFYQVVLFFI